MTYCYDKYSKAHFAGLTKFLAEGAQKGDSTCRWLFSEAGKGLADHIIAVEPKIHPELTKELPIVCIGSVWKSWDLIKDGFIQKLQEKKNRIEKIKLVKLKVGSSVGAMNLGTKAAGFSMPMNYDDNIEMFYCQSL